MTSLFLVLPLFAIYQTGTLLMMDCANGQCQWNANGVDFLTGNLLALTGGSRLAYGVIALSAALALAAASLWARRHAKLSPKLFVPVLVESAVWASIVGPLSIVLSHAIGLGRTGGSWVGDIIASCGAGLHEELVFRAGIFAGLTALLLRFKVRKVFAVLAALAVSSVLFSLVHHVGPLGEPFTVQAFVFRVFMGALFAGIYRVRGFAIAAWTHCVYDIWVFTGQRLHW